MLWLLGCQGSFIFLTPKQTIYSNLMVKVKTEKRNGQYLGPAKKMHDQLLSILPLGLVLLCWDCPRPILLLRSSNLVLPRALVRMSASWSPVEMCSALMLPSSKQLRMKWYLILICLLRSWKTGFFAKASADLLSTFSSTMSTGLPSSSASNLDSHMACVAAVVAATYSASQLESATTFCLMDC